MRILLPVLLVLLFAGCATTPREPVRSVSIKEIKPRYMEAEQFKRISEYWSGGEHTGGRMILRSEPGARSGFYFVLILDEKVRKLPMGTRLIGEFYTPGSPEMETHEFTLPDKRPKTKEVFVGLTGEDWPYDGAVPGAWRFTFETPNGEPMGSAQSYLWAL